MAQGTRVSANFFHDNDADIFVEVNHGPFLFDNNLFFSPVSLRDNSQGGAYVHNLFAGAVKVNGFDGRQTPFMKAHSTTIAGYHDNPRGDDRFYNNVFVQRADLSAYDNAPMPMFMEGNVFLDGAKPSKFDRHAVVEPDFDPRLQIASRKHALCVEIKYSRTWAEEEPHQIVTTASLGNAVIPNLSYGQPDGTIFIAIDYFGKRRSASNPTPGPFERPGIGDLKIKVW
jgi:alpha-N-arabinofuranosidase